MIPKEKRRKWDYKAEEGVLIGYHSDKADYTILDPKTSRMWISRSVKIIETEAETRMSSPEKKKNDEITMLPPLTSKTADVPRYVVSETTAHPKPEGNTECRRRDRGGPDVSENVAKAHIGAFEQECATGAVNIQGQLGFLRRAEKLDRNDSDAAA